MITGLFETHINVGNLERSMEFYGSVLGLELGTIEEERRIAFYWIGQKGKAMLGLWEKSSEPIIKQHFAFQCELDDILNKSKEYLLQRGLEPYNFLNTTDKEPMVFAWMPALAIYFKDPDDHDLEFIAMLPQRPRPNVGIVSYEHWLEISGSD